LPSWVYRKIECELPFSTLVFWPKNAIFPKNAAENVQKKAENVPNKAELTPKKAELVSAAV